MALFVAGHVPSQASIVLVFVVVLVLDLNCSKNEIRISHSLLFAICHLPICNLSSLGQARYQ